MSAAILASDPTASAADPTPVSAPGRSCPLHYRYAPAAFARTAEIDCDTLYVVGGLYGNEPALAAVLDLFERERGRKRLVFNGDFNWFDTDPLAFRRLNETVLRFDALRGNVETEIAADDSGDDDAGCGCAYPDWVDDGVVERSNRILQRLRATARGCPDLRARLAALPMHLRADVGGLRVAIVHGDAESLAGWGFAQEHLQQAAQRRRVRGWFDAAQVDAFACSHTCLPVFHRLPMAGRRVAPVVLNNGAAGMPNFSGDSAGLLTRIATTPFADRTGDERRFGIDAGDFGGVFVDALAVDAASPGWQQQFLAQWPAGSDAHRSYWQRITQGPAHDAAAALITTED